MQSSERQIMISVPCILTMIMWRRRRRWMIGFKSLPHRGSQANMQWYTLRARVQAKEQIVNDICLSQPASRNFAT